MFDSWPGRGVPIQDTALDAMASVKWAKELGDLPRNRQKLVLRVLLRIHRRRAKSGWTREREKAATYARFLAFLIYPITFGLRDRRSPTDADRPSGVCVSCPNMD